MALEMLEAERALAANEFVTHVCVGAEDPPEVAEDAPGDLRLARVRADDDDDVARDEDPCLAVAPVDPPARLVPLREGRGADDLARPLADRGEDLRDAPERAEDRPLVHAKPAGDDAERDPVEVEVGGQMKIHPGPIRCHLRKSHPDCRTFRRSLVIPQIRQPRNLNLGLLKDHFERCTFA